MTPTPRHSHTPTLPYGRQFIDDDDIAAVEAVLRSEWLTQGPAIERFEEKVAAYCGARHAVAVSSATAALHLGAMALDLGRESRVWTSPNTFVASANCARYVGAEVDFVDIDPRTYNLSVERLEEKLDAAQRAGTLPDVIIPVHLAGQCCDLKAIRILGGDYGFRVMEDASHAIGATFHGDPVGNCRYSELSVFSFHPVKIIATGEGGMITTNHDHLAERLRRLRTHGITRDPETMEHPVTGPWYYEQIELGFNYRITDIQAALGCSQMDKLERFVTRRRELAARYDELLKNLPVTVPWQHPDTNSSWHLYIIRLDLSHNRHTHRQVFEDLRAAGIGVQLHYIPVHLQPYYRRLGFHPGDFPEAERHAQEAISLPMFYSLTDAEQDRVCGCLKEILR